MRIICAWCKRIIAEPHPNDVNGQEIPVSHGICPRCLEENELMLEAVKPDHGGEHGGEAGGA